MRILNAAQMREADRCTIEEVGIQSLVLMENAGRQVVAAMEVAYESQLDGRVGILCGRGNNGGDGFVVARTLIQRGVDAAVFVIGSVADIRGDARINLDILGRLSVTVVEIGDEQTWELHFSEISQCTLLIDAIVGTGLTSALGGMMETVVADINTSGIPIVSIDMPSGMSADTPASGGRLYRCVDDRDTGRGEAAACAASGRDARRRCGDCRHWNPAGRTGRSRRTGDRAPDARTGPHANRSHALRSRTRGDFGHVTIVAGSRGKTGAAHLAAEGALRSGAGLVTVATPASCLPILASMASAIMTEPLTEASNGTVVAAAIETVLAFQHDVIACGPGLGRGPAVAEFVRALLDRSTVPLVLDADALTVLADDPSALVGREDRSVIVTPHPGEMARLVGVSVDEVQTNRIQVAADFAASRRLYVVLKGHRTIFATPEGHVFINPTGNAGMATGGTGDILTGMIAAWLAQFAGRRGRLPPRRVPAWRGGRSG